MESSTTSLLQSISHRLLQFVGDQDEELYDHSRSNNTMTFDDNSNIMDNRLDALSNMTDDNMLSWFDNKTSDNSTAEFLSSIASTLQNDSTATTDNNATFDPKVFWSVNAFIFVLFVTTVVWCCFGDKSWLFNVNPEERRQRSDEIYRRNVLERRRQREEAKQETPAQRTQKLLKSFKQNKVQMNVKAEDLIEEDPYDTVKSEQDNDNLDNDIETGSMEDCGQLKLGNGTLVPNCCAICLTSYEVDDKVIWSSNEACAHAFHQDCVVGWLVKMQPETPCPCCRQEFTDLANVRKESKVTWSGSNAFNIGALSLR